MLSSGAMTNRLDHLESRELIRRTPDPADRRALLIELTPTGRTTIDAAIAAHVENLSRILAPLNKREQREAAGLLRKLLVAMEDGGRSA